MILLIYWLSGFTGNDRFLARDPLIYFCIRKKNNKKFLSFASTVLFGNFGQKKGFSLQPNNYFWRTTVWMDFKYSRRVRGFFVINSNLFWISCKVLCAMLLLSDKCIILLWLNAIAFCFYWCVYSSQRTGLVGVKRLPKV